MIYLPLNLSHNTLDWLCLLISDLVVVKKVTDALGNIVKAMNSHLQKCRNACIGFFCTWFPDSPEAHSWIPLSRNYWLTP